MDILTDFSPEALTRAVEGSRAVWMSLGAGWSRFEIHDDPDLLWRTCEYPNPAFNGATRARFEPATTNARLDEILAVFAARELPCVWWVEPSAQPADLGERLQARGFSPPDPVPGMCLDLGAPPGPPPDSPPDLRITPMEDAAARRAYGDVIADSYNAPPEFARSYTEYLDYLATQPGDSLRFLMGWLEDDPVCTAAVLYSDGVAGIYNICTAQKARRKGIGAALTEASLQLAREDGYRIAVLQASEMGMGLYQRVGFQQMCRFDVYWRGFD